jgi:hypothetical protein
MFGINEVRISTIISAAHHALLGLDNREVREYKTIAAYVKSRSTNSSRDS